MEGWGWEACHGINPWSIKGGNGGGSSCKGEREVAEEEDEEQQEKEATPPTTVTNRGCSLSPPNSSRGHNDQSPMSAQGPSSSKGKSIKVSRKRGRGKTLVRIYLMLYISNFIVNDSCHEIHLLYFLLIFWGWVKTWDSRHESLLCVM